MSKDPSAHQIPSSDRHQARPAAGIEAQEQVNDGQAPLLDDANNVGQASLLDHASKAARATGLGISPKLQAANERLRQMRAEAAKQRPSAPQAATANQQPQAANQPPANKEAPSSDSQSAHFTLPDILALPEHLGWGSEPLSRLLRQQQRGKAAPATETTTETTAPVTPDEKESDPPLGGSDQSKIVARPATIAETFATKLYPSIALAMLREEQAASGRLWLLLRGLDQEGCGWVRVADIKQQLAKEGSPTYLCTWRQVRNLLHDGEGLYWDIKQKDTDDGRARLWLRAAAKVAHELGVERLSGQPVALPLEALVNGIGRFRAELYAAFHSGRVKSDPNAQPEPAPIARETLAQLSGVGETTQRRYETAVNLDVKPNYAIGNQVSKEELEEKGWSQGNALFILEDFNGQQGPKGRQYVAWQLPNSYTGSHQQCPKGRQRRINRQLKDLVMKGMPGNGGKTEDDSRMTKLYYPTGKLAAQAFNRRKVDSCYWRRNGRSGQSTSKRYGLWHQLEVNEEK